MKKLCSLCLLLIVVMLWNCCVVSAVPASESCMTLDAKEALAGKNQLLPTAKSVVLYAPDSDTMVYSWNADEPLDPSGMNKIMTALIALEEGDPEAVVSVTAGALSSVESGAMAAGLKAGESMTLRDLLYLMMVGSANDAAAVIAEHIAGSQTPFVSMMNERARELGCTNTVFLNPTGLSVDGQFTTARDLAKITARALKLPAFVEMFSAIEYTVPASGTSPERKAVTTNYMMSDASIQNQLDSRVTGGKTGALSSTDRSLISTAEKDGQKYLAVVMSAKGTMTSSGSAIRIYGNFKETKLLLDHAFSQYEMRQLLSADKVMALFPVSGGENDLAVSSRVDVSALMPADMKSERVSCRCEQSPGMLFAPVQKGDIVGTVQLWYDNMCVAQGDLIAMHSVKGIGTSAVALQPEANVDSGAFKTVVTVCLVVIVIAVLLGAGTLFGIRMVRVARHRKRNKAGLRRR